LTEEAKAFKDEVRYTAKGEKISGSVAMQILYYRPRKAGDIDGILKLCFDSLQGILYDNDKQINELHLYRFDDKKYPRLEVITTKNADIPSIRIPYRWKKYDSRNVYAVRPRK
jgi:Holliday junction resolvase RusA-like endonuclease